MRDIFFLFALLQFSVAVAQPIIDETHCRPDGLPAALRQTVILIDGQMVVPEAEGPLEANNQWRGFARRFVDTLDPLNRQLVDARERITFAVANADGSGITILFSGCVPTFRPEEEAALDAKTGTIEKFLGNDWRRSAASNGEKFRRAATLAMIQGIKGTPRGNTSGRVKFADSPLAGSLAKSVGYSLAGGIPRVIIYTDLSRYDFPTADSSTVRANARQDAQRGGIDFLRAELHVFGASGSQGNAAANYLGSFFLSSRGRLFTLSGATGSLPPGAPPRVVRVFQGTINFPDADYPVRMRLAQDQNGSVLNSWFEVQSVETRYVPFSGLITCVEVDRCKFVGDNVFAQIWSDNPDPKPEFEAWMPLGGMRNFGFDISGEVLDGEVKDEVGYVVGREKGLKFKLRKVPNGVF